MKYAIGFIIGLVIGGLGGVAAFFAGEEYWQEKLYTENNGFIKLEKEYDFAIKAKNYNVAKGVLEKLIEKSKANPTSKYYFVYNAAMADILSNYLGKGNEAHPYYLEAKKYVPQGSDDPLVTKFYLTYAWFLSEKGENKEALNVINEAAENVKLVNRESMTMDWLEARASIHGYLGNKKEMQEDFTKVKEHYNAIASKLKAATDAEYAGMLNNYAYALSSLKAYDEALPVAEEAIAIHTNSLKDSEEAKRSYSATLDTLGMIQHYLGKNEEALANIKKALDLRADNDAVNAEVLRNYATVLTALARNEESCPFLKRASAGYAAKGNDLEQRGVDRLFKANGCK